MTAKAIDEELKTAGDNLVTATAALDGLRAELKQLEDEVVDEVSLPAEKRKELDKLRVSVNRAEAEKNRLQSEYDTLKSKFKLTD